MEDITKTGSLKWKELQEENDKIFTDFQSEILRQQSDYINNAQGDNKKLANLFGLDKSNVYTSDTEQLLKSDFGESKYDKNATTQAQIFQGLNEVRAANQGFGAKLGNSLVNAGVIAGTTILDSWGGMPVGIINAVSTAMKGGSWNDVKGAFINNPWSQFLQNIQEEFSLPVYQSKAYENSSIWRKMGTANFWTESIIKNAGFLVGAYVGGMGANAVLSKAAKLDNALDIFKGAAIRAGVGDKSDEALDLFKRYMSGDLSVTSKQVENALKMTAESVKNRQLGVRIASTWIASDGEARIEALGSAKQYAETMDQLAKQVLAQGTDEQYLLQRLFDEHPEYFQLQLLNPEQYGIDGLKSPQIKPEYQEAANAQLDLYKAEANLKYEQYQQQLKHDFNDYLSKVYLTNMIILLPTNGNVLGKAVTGGWSNASKFVKYGGKAGKTSEGIEKAGIDKLHQAYSRVSSFSGPFSEFIQESSQGAATRAADQFYGKRINDFYDQALYSEGLGSQASFIATLAEEFGSTITDPDKWEEGLAGLITGAFPMFRRTSVKQKDGTYKKEWEVGGGFWEDLREYSQTKKETDEYIKAYNSFIENKDKQNQLKAVIRNKYYQDQMDIAVEQNDKARYKNSEYNQLINTAMMFIANGRKEAFKQTIDNIYTLQNTEDIQTLKNMSLLEDGKSIFENQSDEDILDYFNNTKKDLLQTIDKTYKIVENIEQIWGKNVTDNFKQELAYNILNIDNRESRIKDILKKIQTTVSQNKDRLNSFGIDVDNIEESLNSIQSLSQFFKGQDALNLLEAIEKARDKKQNIFEQIISLNTEALEQTSGKTNVWRDKILKELQEQLEEHQLNNNMLEYANTLKQINDITKYKSTGVLYVKGQITRLSNKKTKLLNNNSDGKHDNEIKDIENRINYLQQEYDYRKNNLFSISESLSSLQQALEQSPDISSMQLQSQDLTDLLYLSTQREAFVHQLNYLQKNPEKFENTLSKRYTESIQFYQDKIRNRELEKFKQHKDPSKVDTSYHEYFLEKLKEQGEIHLYNILNIYNGGISILDSIVIPEQEELGITSDTINKSKDIILKGINNILISFNDQMSKEQMLEILVNKLNTPTLGAQLNSQYPDIPEGFFQELLDNTSTQYSQIVESSSSEALDIISKHFQTEQNEEGDSSENIEEEQTEEKQEEDDESSNDEDSDGNIDPSIEYEEDNPEDEEVQSNEDTEIEENKSNLDAIENQNIIVTPTLNTHYEAEPVIALSTEDKIQPGAHAPVLEQANPLDNDQEIEGRDTPIVNVYINKEKESLQESSINESFYDQTTIDAFVGGVKHTKYEISDLVKHKKTVREKIGTSNSLENWMDNIGVYSFVDDGHLARIQAFYNNKSTPQDVHVHFVKLVPKKGDPYKDGRNQVLLAAVKVASKDRKELKGLPSPNFENPAGDAFYIIGALNTNKDKVSEDQYKQLQDIVQHIKSSGNVKSGVGGMKIKYSSVYTTLAHVLTGRFVRNYNKDGKIISRPLKSILNHSQQQDLDNDENSLTLVLYKKDTSKRVFIGKTITDTDSIVDLNIYRGQDVETKSRAGTLWLLSREADGKYYHKAISIASFTQNFLTNYYDDTNNVYMQDLKKLITSALKSKGENDNAAIVRRLRDYLYLPSDNIYITDDNIIIQKDGKKTVLSKKEGKENTESVLKTIAEYSFKFNLNKEVKLKGIINSNILYSDLDITRNVGATFLLNSLKKEGNSWKVQHSSRIEQWKSETPSYTPTGVIVVHKNRIWKNVNNQIYYRTQEGTWYTENSGIQSPVTDSVLEDKLEFLYIKDSAIIRNYDYVNKDFLSINGVKIIQRVTDKNNVQTISYYLKDGTKLSSTFNDIINNYKQSIKFVHHRTYGEKAKENLNKLRKSFIGKYNAFKDFNTKKIEYALSKTDLDSIPDLDSLVQSILDNTKNLYNKKGEPMESNGVYKILEDLISNFGDQYNLIERFLNKKFFNKVYKFVEQNYDKFIGNDTGDSRLNFLVGNYRIIDDSIKHQQMRIIKALYEYNTFKKVDKSSLNTLENSTKEQQPIIVIPEVVEESQNPETQDNQKEPVIEQPKPKQKGKVSIIPKGVKTGSEQSTNTQIESRQENLKKASLAAYNYLYKERNLSKEQIASQTTTITKLIEAYFGIHSEYNADDFLQYFKGKCTI